MDRITRPKKAIKKQIESRRKHSRPFVCDQSGEIFYLMTDAASRLGVSAIGVSKVLNGKHKTTGGYSFSWWNGPDLRLLDPSTLSADTDAIKIT